MTRLIIELTSPDGQPVWMDPSSISKFAPSTDHPGGTILWSFAGTQEVRESPDQILHTISASAYRFHALRKKMRKKK